MLISKTLNAENLDKDHAMDFKTVHMHDKRYLDTCQQT